MQFDQIEKKEIQRKLGEWEINVLRPSTAEKFLAVVYIIVTKTRAAI